MRTMLIAAVTVLGVGAAVLGPAAVAAEGSVRPVGSLAELADPATSGAGGVQAATQTATSTTFNATRESATCLPRSL